jgi:hypothetical protein
MKFAEAALIGWLVDLTLATFMVIKDASMVKACDPPLFTAVNKPANVLAMAVDSFAIDRMVEAPNVGAAANAGLPICLLAAVKNATMAEFVPLLDALMTVPDKVGNAATFEFDVYLTRLVEKLSVAAENADTLLAALDIEEEKADETALMDFPNARPIVAAIVDMLEFATREMAR